MDAFGQQHVHRPHLGYAGTLQVGNGGSGASIGGTSGMTIASNATLVFNHADAVTVAAVISGNGKLTQAGTGILTLLGSNTYTGSTTISAGTLQIGNGGAAGAGRVPTR